MYFILLLVIGLAAGWLAGVVMKGKGFGMAGNMIVGIVGAFIGAYLFKFIGFVIYGLIGTLIMAFVGAVVLIFIIRLVKKA